MKPHMKRGKLIFNINAGSARASMLDNILEKIQRAGYAASYEETKSVEALKSIIQQPYDVLFVAGGDGTLREVARCLLTQPASSRPPIILLPMGTANNVASMLMPNMQMNDILDTLDTTCSSGFDIGYITHQKGESFFLEGAGTGLFGNIMAAYKPETGKSSFRALRASLETLSVFEAETLKLSLDGIVKTEAIYMLEFMNTSSLGYRFKLAKYADSSDGLLDVLIVRASDEISLPAYVASVLAERFEELPNIELVQARSATLTLPDWSFHTDAEVIEAPGVRLNIEVLHHALEFLLPQHPKSLDVEHSSRQQQTL